MSRERHGLSPAVVFYRQLDGAPLTDFCLCPLFGH
jgi:hypothetical protein